MPTCNCLCSKLEMSARCSMEVCFFAYFVRRWQSLENESLIFSTPLSYIRSLAKSSQKLLTLPLGFIKNLA